MKVIIAGGRKFKPDVNSMLWLIQLLKELKPSEIVSGGAKGADNFGEKAARALDIPVRQFPAKWNDFGRKAGMMRNKQMAEYADICILFSGGVGTANMKKEAKDRGLIIYEYGL
jgi:hypothetical protein